MSDQAIPEYAQINLTGWTIVCDSCGREQKLDHMAWTTALDRAVKLGWVRQISQESTPVSVGLDVIHDAGPVVIKDFCPECFKAAKEA